MCSVVGRMVGASRVFQTIKWHSHEKDPARIVSRCVYVCVCTFVWAATFWCRACVLQTHHHAHVGRAISRNTLSARRWRRRRQRDDERCGAVATSFPKNGWNQFYKIESASTRAHRNDCIIYNIELEFLVTVRTHCVFYTRPVAEPALRALDSAYAFKSWECAIAARVRARAIPARRRCCRRRPAKANGARRHIEAIAGCGHWRVSEGMRVGCFSARGTARFHFKTPSPHAPMSCVHCARSPPYTPLTFRSFSFVGTTQNTHTISLPCGLLNEWFFEFVLGIIHTLIIARHYLNQHAQNIPIYAMWESICLIVPNMALLLLLLFDIKILIIICTQIQTIEIVLCHHQLPI